VIYNRICKLLYFKIKPIFVFDGPNVPKLKEKVLVNKLTYKFDLKNNQKETAINV
jgi:hypothetical protein